MIRCWGRSENRRCRAPATHIAISTEIRHACDACAAQPTGWKWRPLAEQGCAFCGQHATHLAANVLVCAACAKVLRHMEPPVAVMTLKQVARRIAQEVERQATA
jgi:hypothetical protein